MTNFGPQLIGRTEKGLAAILHRVLARPGLSEPEWVVLRLTAQHDGRSDLTTVITGRTRFEDVDGLIEGLERRGLLDHDRLTDAGRALLADLTAEITITTTPIWADLDPADVVATERVLSTVIARTDTVLRDQAADDRLPSTGHAIGERRT